MMINISGKIVEKGTNKKLSGAVFKASLKDGQEISTISDSEGAYQLDNVQPGEWTLVALKEKYFPSEIQKLELASSHNDVNFELFKLMEEGDKKSGNIFFFSLIGVLILLIIAYITLHLVFPQVSDPNEMQSAFLWTGEPLRMIEVLTWGLAGVLVEKIITTGYYLRRGKFYREGILMHISHIISVPLMVLVVVFLLSLVTISITLTGNNEVNLNLEDPRVLVAISFILGAVPWNLRNFIQRTAEKITS